MTKRHAPPLPILAEILILSGRATIRVNYWFADTWQYRHVGWQNNASFFPPIFTEKSLVHSGGKSFCSCEPTWLSRRQMQTSNTNSTRDCSWQIKLPQLMYITLENVSEKRKKCLYHLKNVFIVSLSVSTYDWFTGYFLPVSDWSQTSKQTKTDTGSWFIDVLSSLVLEKPIITPCFLIKIFALSVTKTDVTGAWAIIF